MNRRSLIRNVLLAGVGVSLPLKGLWAGTKSPLTRPYHRFQLGDLELTTITDGYVHMSPVHPGFAPEVPAAQVNDLLKKNFRPTDYMDLGLNILVVKKKDQVILIDTGVGSTYGKNSGWLMSSLADAGIAATDISTIIISHGHPDHVGGLLNADGVINFPNATVYVSRLEHEFWMAAEQDFSKSTFENKDLLKTYTKATQQIFTTIKPKLQLFDDGQVLHDCIRLEIAPGHTPGHTITHIYSGNQSIVHVADLIHSDVLLFPHPEWGFNGDTDFHQAIATRKKVLAKLTASATPIFAYHLPWPGIGHARKKDQAFEWVAETYAYPQ
ncbi:Glyoxylase, beta-lactamase superfamily II [Chitinophaga jiangningensis]|uniref:Glyoxylase, beta-lactamase superfamily II n=1 Tax=Chitinophaga jiangningensis TaxID=1419482 RepID=A0A1M7KJG7_9BACT|nr:MBL fold metallo-hydrolase [Chitinophaga jiangningensis]SHM65051.1 Glyoxylase, beta-lactamase superfamily II [Chitinophaga jiangningensis]